MGDRITERAEALGLPWFSRSMRIATALLSVLLFATQLVELPDGGPGTVLGALLAGLLMSILTAMMITTWLKMASLVVRLPLSLYLYP